MPVFGLLFLLALAAVTGVRLWLARRQLRHARRHRGEVPQAFRDRIGTGEQTVAADYQAARLRLGMVETAAGAGLVLALTLGGGVAALLEAARTLAGPGWLAGTLAAVAVAGINGLLDLPFAAWRTFRIEARFGFNRSSPGLFLADTLKAALLGGLLIGLLAAGLLGLMAASGRWWWLSGWGLWLAFTLALTWAYPKWIAPLFNRFRPLQDAEVRGRIRGLLARCGFALAGVYVMDASRRTAHGNAFFTGLGSAKRVVFFDTLLQTLEPAETEAVLAHELGHYRLGHIRNGVALSALAVLAGLALLAWLRTQPWFFTGLGAAAPSDAGALILAALAAPVLLFPLQPLAAAWSRRRELAADAFAARHSDAAALAGALVKLYRDNAALLSADPLFARVHHSHPLPAERIARLQGGG
ncbi:MAG TPA: M48 family metallopeptidase [Gammaproteobacteria bacterium]|nr:M48 family metallopeptidase [Gammaproteobacteria bacterium]